MTNKLDTNEVYTATIEFRSVGDSAFVQPTFNYSHDLDPDSDELPASYLALRDVGMVLRMMMSQQQTAEYTDEELVQLPADEQIKAVTAAAKAAASVAKVEAHKLGE